MINKNEELKNVAKKSMVITTNISFTPIDIFRNFFS